MGSPTGHTGEKAESGGAPEALVHVVGVRHHSPACAGLVRAELARLRPRWVLIEGPSDMNARLDELFLPHVLPIAVFTWLREGRGRAHLTWSPLCEHSPEWVALTLGAAQGARVRFMDLPAWHPAFRDVENRYSDRRGDAQRERAEAYQDELCRAFRVDDTDVLWDHLFELPIAPHPELGEPSSQLARRLDTHFEALRGDAPAGPRDEPREAFMLRCVAFAAAEASAHGGTATEGGVLVVCGGFHRPALVRGLAAALAAVEARYPEPPEPEPEEPGAELGFGSYLVPYGNKRLDSLVGYASGMSSPGFYELVWREGAERAAERALVRIAARLRRKRQRVSTADLVACHAMAEGLSRVRGHGAIARVDLLDAIAATLVKDALDVPAPWARRGVLQRGTDALLVEVVAELAGEAVGVLAPGTPRPPLLHDVEATLAAHDLTPSDAPRALELDLVTPGALQKSHVLHRLRLLEVPGFVRTAGPRWATDAELRERWTLRRELDAEAHLIERAALGGTLDEAARAALEERLTSAEGALPALADALGDAIAAGLLELARSVRDRVLERVEHEPSLAALGEALTRVFDVERHGELLAAAGHPTLSLVVDAAFERGLWLFEGLGAGGDEPEVRAVVALRDVARARGTPALAARAVDLPDTDHTDHTDHTGQTDHLGHMESAGPSHAERLAAVCARRVGDLEASPPMRGAGLGALVSLHALAGAHVMTPHDALSALKRTPPSEVGDLLSGLFSLAREAMLAEPELVETLDGLLTSMQADELLAALPALRFSFAKFPPLERARIAERVAALYGLSSGRELTRLPVTVDELTAGLALDAEVSALATRFGLTDGLDAPALDEAKP
jgi:hypothetical protein